MTITDPVGFHWTAEPGFLAVDQNDPVNAQLTEKLLKKHKGHSFAEIGQAYSRVCSDWLVAEGWSDLVDNQIPDYLPALTVGDVIGNNYPALGEFKSLSELL